MNWKFWSKKEQQESGMNNENLPKPNPIPEVVGRHMVVEMKKDPDFVWKRMAVRRPRSENKNAFDVRVYSPAEAGLKGVKIKNYDTLDSMPELIMFEGWYDKRENTAKLVDKSSR
jgi:hypothetical protein